MEDIIDFMNPPTQEEEPARYEEPPQYDPPHLKAPVAPEQDYLNFESNLQSLNAHKVEEDRFEKEKDDLDMCFSNLNALLGKPREVEPSQPSSYDPPSEVGSLIPDYKKMYAQPSATSEYLPAAEESNAVVGPPPTESYPLPLRDTLNDRDEPSLGSYQIKTDIDAILSGNLDFKRPTEVDQRAVAVDYSRPPL